jgi:hypothetical protein
MTTYTTLEVSRLIASKVPEVETDFAWIRKGITWMLAYKTELGDYVSTLGTHHHAGIEEKLTAYRLDDAIRAIKVYGEKEGWWVVDTASAYDSRVIEESLNLVQAYLASDCNMADPMVGEVLISIFK